SIIFLMRRRIFNLQARNLVLLRSFSPTTRNHIFLLPQGLENCSSLFFCSLSGSLFSSRSSLSLSEKVVATISVAVQSLSSFLFSHLISHQLTRPFSTFLFSSSTFSNHRTSLGFCNIPFQSRILSLLSNFRAGFQQLQLKS